jgi:[histone H4]-lysine20 N-methyltransferase SETD8
VLSGTTDGLEVRDFGKKGRGVVTTREFHKGEFVVEYAGELIDNKEAKRREEEYSQDDSIGCYMFKFKYLDRPFWIDATAESGKLGRLVNHGQPGNLAPQITVIDGLPRLLLYAREDISKGEELSYDYGEWRKDVIRYHPWLKQSIASSLSGIPDSQTSHSQISISPPHYQVGGGIPKAAPVEGGNGKDAMDCSGPETEVS